MPRVIPCRYTEEEIRPFFLQPRYPTLAKLLPFLHRPIRPQRLERVWLPFYCFEVETQTAGKASTIDMTVEAWSAAFAIFDMHGDLVDLEPHDTVFAPRLSEAEAREAGMKELVNTILRQRTRGPRPVPGEVLQAELIYIPYWICYYQRRPGVMDVRIRDAATAKPAGNRNRHGILVALAATHAAAE